MADHIHWNGYTIERVSESHINDLIAISESAFNITPARSYYIDKNNTGLFGEPYLGYIAFDAAGEGAAFYGVYACQAILDNRVYNVAQSGDTMTHKNHVGKGLFTKLAELTYDLCREKGVSFVFGFPNYNSYPGFVKKLNWKCPGNLREYKLKILTFPLLKIVKKLPFLLPVYSIYLALVNSFYSKSLNIVKSSALATDVGGLHRTNDFMHYKFKCGGSYVIKIDSVDTWLKADGFLFLGDAVSDKMSGKSYLRKLRRYAFLIGADVVLFQAVEGCGLELIFRQFYTSKEAFPYGYCQLDSGVDPSRFRYVMADMDTF